MTINVTGAGWWTVAGLPWLPPHLEMASLQTATAYRNNEDGSPTCSQQAAAPTSTS